VSEELTASVCCGLTEVQDRDDARALLARADSALYSAKAAGSNRVFVHASGHIREDISSPAIIPIESVATPDVLPIGVPAGMEGA
jgi:predicted signal transduction protein with EAL and GGDEF domain